MIKVLMLLTLVVQILLWGQLISGQEIKMGVMADTTNVQSWESILNQGSAINIAYDALIRDGVLTTNTTFRIIPKDTKETKDGLGNAVELIRNEFVDVIIGHPSSEITQAMAHLTSYWNFPQITWSGHSIALSNKSTFTTLVRTAGPITEVAQAIVQMFRWFDWQNLGIISMEEGVCAFSTTSIRELFPEVNLTIRTNIIHPQVLPISIETIDDYTNQLKQNCRIIYICAEDWGGMKSIRTFLIRFCKLGMCQGDYVFLFADKEIPVMENFLKGDADDEIVKIGLKYLFMFTPTTYVGEIGRTNLIKFGLEVIERMTDIPWNSTEAKDKGIVMEQWKFKGLWYNAPGRCINPLPNNKFTDWSNLKAFADDNINVNRDAVFLYDAAYLFGLWVNYSLTHGLQVNNGTAFLDFSRDRSFESVAGPCIIGETGDRIPNFLLYQYHDDGLLYEAAVILTTAQTIEIDDNLIWYTSDGQPIKDVPICGFRNGICNGTASEDDTSSWILATCLSAVSLLAIAGIGFLIRKKQVSNVMMQSSWRINVAEIQYQKSRIGIGSAIASKNTLSQGSLSHLSSMSVTDRMDVAQTRVALLKGHIVVVRRLPHTSINLNNEDLSVLKIMREMTHENINAFVGACFEPGSSCAVFQYCSKGGLQDILENEEIQLDMTFKNSLTNDLVKGLCYIHESKLGVHGRLKSTNCVVDNRWNLKLTDFGLDRFTNKRNTSEMREEHEKYKCLLWTAPELLNQANSLYIGTKAGDIYSFGIILHEIYFRQGPFAGNSKMTAKEIIQHVRQRAYPPCRPTIFVDNPDATQVITHLMQLCWADNEADRPTTQTIKSYIKKNIHDIGKNIMEIVLKRLEKYASNLEGLVEQRTHELILEKQKIDKLLYRMLPRSCADKLKVGQPVDPEVFESATVFFSDIVGFTMLSSRSSPMEVIELLNDLYTCFDNVIEHFDAYKVETIGDGYLVVSGVPQRNGKRHAGAIADMSLEMRDEVSRFKIKHMPDEQIKVRIGIHTGPCCAGVVGLTMPRYCLFGDTINVASRMESAGESQKIHISESTNEALHELGGFYTVFRAEIEIKGKGKMRTFWLTGKAYQNEAAQCS